MGYLKDPKSKPIQSYSMKTRTMEQNIVFTVTKVKSTGLFWYGMQISAIAHYLKKITKQKLI